MQQILSLPGFQLTCSRVQLFSVKQKRSLKNIPCDTTLHFVYQHQLLFCRQATTQEVSEMNIGIDLPGKKDVHRQGKQQFVQNDKQMSESAASTSARP